jgi:inosose dehydratase
VSRGELTGIAVSQCAIGDGVNAENIRRCIRILAASGYDGVLSLECDGQGGPMLEQSLTWAWQAVKGAIGKEN